MNKEFILNKIEETKKEFDALQQRKADLQKEIIKCDQEIYRLDGKYIAYDSVLKEFDNTPIQGVIETM